MRRDEIFLRFVFASLSRQKRGPGVSADDAQKKSAEPIGSALRGFVTSWGRYATIWAACVSVAKTMGVNRASATAKAANLEIVFISFPQVFQTSLTMRCRAPPIWMHAPLALMQNSLAKSGYLTRALLVTAQKKSREPLGWFAASLIDRRRRVWGDQATIKAAWFNVANAIGAKKASAAAMQKNLVICVAPFLAFRFV